MKRNEYTTKGRHECINKQEKYGMNREKETRGIIGKKVNEEEKRIQTTTKVKRECINKQVKYGLNKEKESRGIIGKKLMKKIN